ncbi:hypothetical protein Harman_22110 [Haloarcula mannanilytica]|uniref:Uncharacterized protein n=1 Tax=Haloarcula mannanilytica TaxID=2509225 RepID=A0A4C2EIU0_9EURY|nr:hypothetical protein Harman_22110 [Haloarcula mannanilytica]
MGRYCDENECFDSQKAPDTLRSRGSLRSSVVSLPAVLPSPGFPERIGPFQSLPCRLTEHRRGGIERGDCLDDGGR